MQRRILLAGWGFLATVAAATLQQPRNNVSTPCVEAYKLVKSGDLKACSGLAEVEDLAHVVFKSNRTQATKDVHRLRLPGSQSVDPVLAACEAPWLGRVDLCDLRMLRQRPGASFEVSTRGMLRRYRRWSTRSGRPVGVLLHFGQDWRH